MSRNIETRIRKLEARAPRGLETLTEDELIERIDAINQRLGGKEATRQQMMDEGVWNPAWGDMQAEVEAHAVWLEERRNGNDIV